MWSKFLSIWLRTFGAPAFILMDQGLEFQGHFIMMLESHGIQPLLIDRDAPYQNGVTERTGGLFKEVYYRTRELKQPATIEEAQDVIHEVSWAMQTMTNRSGYSPAQRVFAKQPSLGLDLLSEVRQYEYSMTQDDAWARSEELRKAARQALRWTPMPRREFKEPFEQDPGRPVKITISKKVIPCQSGDRVDVAMWPRWDRALSPCSAVTPFG